MEKITEIESKIINIIIDYQNELSLVDIMQILADCQKFIITSVRKGENEL